MSDSIFSRGDISLTTDSGSGESSGDSSDDYFDSFSTYFTDASLSSEGRSTIEGSGISPDESSDRTSLSGTTESVVTEGSTESITESSTESGVTGETTESGKTILKVKLLEVNDYYQNNFEQDEAFIIRLFISELAPHRF